MAFCDSTNYVPYISGAPGSMHFNVDLIDGPPVITDPLDPPTCTLAGSPYGHQLKRFSTAYTSLIVDGITYYPSDGLHGGPPTVNFTSNQRIWVPCRDVDDPGELGPAIIVTVPSDDPGNPNPPDTFNIAPTADPGSHTGYAEVAVPFVLVASAGSGPGPLVYEIISGASHGNVTGTEPNLTYTPSNNWIGVDDTFAFRVHDGLSWSEPAVWTFTTYPLVVSLTPTHGPIAGGTTVVITGVGLHNTISVTFDGVAATVTDVATDGHSVTCVTPAHVAGLVDVVVTGPNHTSSSAIAATLLYFYDVDPDDPDWVIGQWELHGYEMRARAEQTS